MKTKREIDKRNRFINAYSCRTSRNIQFFCPVIGNYCHRPNLISSKNYLIQEQAARRMINYFIQANFAELEQRVLASQLQDGEEIDWDKIDFSTMYGRTENANS